MERPVKKQITGHESIARTALNENQQILLVHNLADVCYTILTYRIVYRVIHDAKNRKILLLVKPVTR